MCTVCACVSECTHLRTQARRQDRFESREFPLALCVHPEHQIRHYLGKAVACSTSVYVAVARPKHCPPVAQTDGVACSKTSFFHLIDLVSHDWLSLLTVTRDCLFIVVLPAHSPKYARISQHLSLAHSHAHAGGVGAIEGHRGHGGRCDRSASAVWGGKGRK